MKIGKRYSSSSLPLLDLNRGKNQTIKWKRGAQSSRPHTKYSGISPQDWYMGKRVSCLWMKKNNNHSPNPSGVSKKSDFPEYFRKVCEHLGLRKPELSLPHIPRHSVMFLKVCEGWLLHSLETPYFPWDSPRMSHTSSVNVPMAEVVFHFTNMWKMHPQIPKGRKIEIPSTQSNYTPSYKKTASCEGKDRIYFFLS